MQSARKTLPPALSTVLALVAAAPAYAHERTGLAGGFVAGFQHPLFGLDHLLAMVAVGLWGAVLGRPLLILLPVVFPVVMAVGGVLGMAAIPVPPVEIAIALSVLVLGGLIALRVAAPVWAACVIVGGFAVFHGYAHGQELPSAADPLGYSAGFVVATGLLHLAGIGLGWATGRWAGLAADRAMGALIAAAGVWFLVGAASA